MLPRGRGAATTTTSSGGGRGGRPQAGPPSRGPYRRRGDDDDDDDGDEEEEDDDNDDSDDDDLMNGGDGDDDNDDDLPANDEDGEEALRDAEMEERGENPSAVKRGRSSTGGGWEVSHPDGGGGGGGGGSSSQAAGKRRFEDVIATMASEGTGASATSSIREHVAMWKRPPVGNLSPSTQPIVFQQLEVDYTLGPYVAGMPGVHSSKVPIVRMFGVTGEGHSVLVNVFGFVPYFFIAAPKGFQERDCEQFRKELNDRVKPAAPQGDLYPDVIVKVSVVLKQSIMGYKAADEKMHFLRIETASPRHVPTARGVLEASFRNQGHVTYESNIPYVLRFMIDRKIVGANWIEIPAGRYQPVANPSSHCQIEVNIGVNDFVSYVPEGEWLKLSPFRVMSFDIECAGRRGVFPDPEHDPVIQIANIVTLHGTSTPFIRNVFCLKKTAAIAGAHVLYFENERDMLAAWAEFMLAVDPDIVTGYNICNFDLKYLLNRAQKLKIPKFFFLGRLRDSKSRIKTDKFSSKAFGQKETITITTEGRVQFDVLLAVQRDYKLRSYTLNSVSAHFLGEQKEDVHHSIISELFNGSEEDRRRLALYCLKDAYLPLRLLDKLMTLINYIEMARVTGVPLDFLLMKGQQVKVVSQLYRKTLQEDIVIPSLKPSKTSETYEGASVISPLKGFYDTPIATLDFTSLYPSIMMAHNLCYTTLLRPADAAQMPPDSYQRTPCGDHFVKATKRKGILPQILEELLAARQRAKDDLKRETDPFKKAVLDGRQLALKISANSVYGFTGATVGKLPCLEISASVTAFGRDMIAETKRLVEERYTIANGYKNDAVVIYGDTDSVMVKFGVATVAEAMELGREASKHVTTHFVRPINLDFEKVYYPYLLISKKRYAGLFWTKPANWDKMDTKGIESVRRDNCPLVSSVVSTVLNKILIDRTVDGAREFVQQTISDLLCNRLDLSLLVISKALTRREGDYVGKQAHVELAKRMQQRDPGTAPHLGDRVPYVMVNLGKKAKNYEKAEDPLYVLEHGLPLDTEYYLQKQLAKPLMRLFAPVLKDPKILLNGSHTRSINITKASASAGNIVGWTTRSLTCLGCRGQLPAGYKTVCDYCKPREAEIYAERLGTMNHYQREFSTVWAQCQRCQGSFHQPVLCASRDCPVFYMRKKVQKDLQDQQEVLDRFDQAELRW